jgi:hypothetical protein
MEEGRNMTRFTTMVATVAIVASMSVAPSVASGTTTATQDCWFNLGILSDASAPSWVCRLDFGEVDYWAAAFPVGSGKAFATTPNGPAIFFEEIVEIYDSLDFAQPNGVVTSFSPGTVLFRGVDSGVVNAAGNWYIGNGSVELAVGPFAGLEGHTYHAGGPIEWYPFGAPFRSLGGTFSVH